jgi:serine/threonine-protein kinase
VLGGKYRVEEFIGSGAMGSVYRARQISLEKQIALKVLHPHLRSDNGFVTRFHREAKAASRLDHPNAVRVIDFGEDSSADPVASGRLYIAMELLEGRDLFEVIQEDFPLPRARTIEIMRQTLAAVAAAHDVGIIHRDLKPENIMVARRVNDDGEAVDHVKVCDFGIAKMSERDADSEEESRKLSVMGLLVGTPEYMSPEQARGETLDVRSDVYALGVVLYQMLVGRVPFEGTQPLDVALRHISDEPVAPRVRQPDADALLEAIALRAMAKDRGLRYQNAREMRAVLRAALEGRAVASAADGTGVFNSLPPMYTPPPPGSEGAPDLPSAQMAALVATLDEAPPSKTVPLPRFKPGARGDATTADQTPHAVAASVNPQRAAQVPGGPALVPPTPFSTAQDRDLEPAKRSAFGAWVAVVLVAGAAAAGGGAYLYSKNADAPADGNRSNAAQAPLSGSVSGASASGAPREVPNGKASGVPSSGTSSGATPSHAGVPGQPSRGGPPRVTKPTSEPSGLVAPSASTSAAPHSSALQREFPDSPAPSAGASAAPPNVPSAANTVPAPKPAPAPPPDLEPDSH